MKHGSLFSGIGGFDLAAQWMGWDNVFHCEINKYNQKVLNKNFPNSILYNDIRTTDFTIHRGLINVLTGGFPCQDISNSGKGAGIFGGKSGLWTEYNRAIKEINPDFVVIENSPQLLNRGFEKVLFDLSENGYDAEWRCIPATWVGASHERERVFIVAYPSGLGLQGILQGLGEGGSLLQQPSNKIIIRSVPESFDKLGNYQRVRNTDGVPNQLDRVFGCGNAIVPQIAYQIFKVINQLILCQ